LSGKTVTLPAASVTSHVTAFDDNQLKEDIALLAFKQATSDSVVKYDLVDQTIDVFQDASGVDASGSTDEIRNASNYYSGVSVGSYSTDSFTSTGASTWTAPANTPTAELLIVAGGGGGGGETGCGGGGGGVVHDTAYSLTSGVEYDITVGAGGGAGGQWGHQIGANGGNSVFNVNAEGSGSTLTAIGGGSGGGRVNHAGRDGGSGGCGHGSGADGSTTQETAGTATGGTITAYGEDAPGDVQGGGAGEQGDGSGKSFANFTSYGLSGVFGKGEVRTSGTGQNSAADGAANTGNAGEGSNTGGFSGFGGNGGTGVVLIRHRTEAYNDMTLVSNATTAEAVPTKADLVMTYTNGVGTATIGSDLTAEVSRDGGTTWTSFGLSSSSDQGDTGGHTILTAHDLDISGQPSGTSMQYRIKTLNQDASKETRI
ncbi:MAG: hypothetical protein QGF90_19075, partial [Gammaproteobacteria bacterium]|nr:hypothetical protein [Gammaproteobacteria bacterium]